MKKQGGSPEDAGADQTDEATIASGARPASGAPPADEATVASGTRGNPGESPRDEATVASGAAPAPPPADHAVPARIGPYQVLRELGRGGMGVVYLVLDPGLERRVALKLLPPRLSGDPAAFARFRREAKLLASLNHPNIATVHSLEDASGQSFLTMEMIEGESLSDRLRQGMLGIDEALAVCRQLAVALEAAHRAGIVHLDLKPGNVMITSDGLVKVLDFGLALALGRESEETEEARTRGGLPEVIGGTPGFMSPEQIRGEAVDSRADIWAFGCILFQCLGGRPAFPGNDVAGRMLATLESEPDLQALPPAVAPRLRELLRRSLLRPLDQRLDSITKLRRGIEEEIALRAVPAPAARAESVPNNLPLQLSGFIGRAEQRAEVRELVRAHRLLTLTGIGGGGKTRLALEVGGDLLDEAPHGVWLLELAPLNADAQVAAALAMVLGLKDAGQRPLTEVLIQHLKERNTLLILDNCEHLIQAAAGLAADLLAGCPDLRILATSREPLGVAGEEIYHVPSMTLPPTGRAIAPEEAAGAEAVQLFLARAQSVRRDFALTPENTAAVAQICRRLDGIPLALELAAARIKVLPPEEIARRLDDRFRLLTSSKRAALPHHQTLRALIDWSFDHLSFPEQTLLTRLSIFNGGWTLEAAEAVCAGGGSEGEAGGGEAGEEAGEGAAGLGTSIAWIEEWEVLDLLSNLVDKSLVEADAHGGQSTGMARYRMLETIRDYARGKLGERGEEEAVFLRHRDYFLGLAEESEPKLMGSEQALALKRLSAEHENLRRALTSALRVGTDPEIGWRLSGALGRYWVMRGHWSEGRETYRALLSREDAPRESPAAANALNWAGNLAKLQGDYEQARTHLEESLAVRRRLGHDAGIASSLNNLGNVLKDQGRLAEARSLYEESLALQKKQGNRVGAAQCLNSLGVLAHLLRDYPAAVRFHEESLGIRRELGDRWGTAASLINLGMVDEAMGELDRAYRHLEESLKLYREIGDRWGIAASLNNLGRLAERRDDLEQARSFYEEGLATFRDLGDRRGMASSLNNLGLVCSRQGDRARAGSLLRESLRTFHELKDNARTSGLVEALARLAAEAGDDERAVRLLGGAEALRADPGAAGGSEALAEPAGWGAVWTGLRERLDEESLRSLRSDGRALSREQLLDYALREEGGT